MKRRILRWLSFGAAGLALAAGVAFASVPGYHRAATPGLFGMTQAAPNLYIDDSAQADAVLALIAKAETATIAFFGELRANPIYIICTTQQCKDDFGIKPRAITVGYHWILVEPKGVTQLILTHERIHAELHRFMGISDILNQRFPAWFDEGLASHISGDDRLNRPENPRDADWIRTAHSFGDWGALHKKHNWQDTYGAAARLVQEIDAQIGRDGLLQFIKEVGAGAEFEAALTTYMAKP